MLQRDKALHALVGGAIFSVVYTISHLVGLPALAIAAAAVVIAAIGKELYDRQRPDRHTADVMDAVATVAGGVVCAIPLLTTKAA